MDSHRLKKERRVLYEAESGDITMALAGDVLVHRRFACYREPRFRSLWEIFHSADLGYANLEGVSHRYDHRPAMRRGLFSTAFPPECLDDLRQAGINLVSCANNHSFDYGEGALMETIGHLDRAGIAHAGTGRHLREARSAGYVETPKGRVGLISVTATFTEHHRAGDQGPDLPGRPGASCLGYSMEYVVDGDSLKALRKMARRLGMKTGTDPQLNKEIVFLGSRFVQGREVKATSKPSPVDLDDIIHWVKDAGRQADWVIVSLHSHEDGATPQLPADFVRVFARACIDAGAHLFVGHGPHYLRGVEIYNQRPIFYSLGNLFFQLEGIPWHPREAYERLNLGYDAHPSDFYPAYTNDETKGFPADRAYWRSVVPVCEWRSRALKEIRLHPIDLGQGLPWSQRGRPVLADRAVGREILETLGDLSAPFSTRVQIQGTTGRIVL